MEIAKGHYAVLKKAALRALYSQFDIAQDESWDKKLTSSPEFKILCIFGMIPPAQLRETLQHRDAPIRTASENITRLVAQVIGDPVGAAASVVRDYIKDYVSDYQVNPQLILTEIGVDGEQQAAEAEPEQRLALMDERRVVEAPPPRQSMLALQGSVPEARASRDFESNVGSEDED
jgi:hypothetical protein